MIYNHALLNYLNKTDLLQQAIENYEQNFSQRPEFTVLLINSPNKGTESISFPNTKIWELVPSEITKMKSLRAFNFAINNWQPENWPCMLHETYMGQVVFI